jgi:hypothetical protein
MALHWKIAIFAGFLFGALGYFAFNRNKMRNVYAGPKEELRGWSITKVNYLKEYYIRDLEKYYKALANGVYFNGNSKNISPYPLDTHGDIDVPKDADTSTSRHAVKWAKALVQNDKSRESAEWMWNETNQYKEYYVRPGFIEQWEQYRMKHNLDTKGFKR